MVSAVFHSSLDTRSAKLIDGTVWDGRDPKKYAESFKVQIAA